MLWIFLYVLFLMVAVRQWAHDFHEITILDAFMLICFLWLIGWFVYLMRTNTIGKILSIPLWQRK